MPNKTETTKSNEYWGDYDGGFDNKGTHGLDEEKHPDWSEGFIDGTESRIGSEIVRGHD